MAERDDHDGHDGRDGRDGRDGADATSQHTVVIALPDVYRELQSLATDFRVFYAMFEEREKHRVTHEARLQRLERKLVPATATTAIVSLVVAVSTGMQGGLL